MRGRAKRRNLNAEYLQPVGVQDQCPKFHNNWTLYSVWNPNTFQKIFQFTNEYRIPMSQRSFFDILKKTFYVDDKDLELNYLEMQVLRITDIKQDLEDDRFLEKPLELKARKFKFGKVEGEVERNFPSAVTLVCGGSFAEMINGMLSPSDVLIVSSVADPKSFTNPSNRRILLNDEEKGGNLQVIRIPVIGEEIPSPFHLIEKIKPFAGDIFTFRYLAWDLRTNYKRDATTQRIFTAEQQKRDMCNPSGEVFDVTNPRFFYMPIHRYMSPKLIFDFLIYDRRGNSLASISECDSETEEDTDDDIKKDTQLFKSMYSTEPKETVVLIPRTRIRTPSILATILAVILLLFFYTLSQNESNDEKNTVSQNSPSILEESGKNWPLAVVYDWEFVASAIIEWKDWILSFLVCGINCMYSIVLKMTNLSTEKKEDFGASNEIGDGFQESCIILESTQYYISVLQNVSNPGQIISNMFRTVYEYVLYCITTLCVRHALIHDINVDYDIKDDLNIDYVINDDVNVD